MLKCAVFGSINMDMVVKVDRFPEPGESRRGRSFQIVPGGKGGNQAVALGRLGADVMMAGCVGDDEFSAGYLANFSANGVKADAVARIPDCTTGTALIEVNDEGENHIVVVPGANLRCDGAWLEQALALTADRDIFLFQLEITHESDFEAIRRVHAAGKTVILDPAPAAYIPDDVLACVDYITPNETELRLITDDLPKSADTDTRMRRLKEKGVGVVIAKSGSDGAYVLCGEEKFHVPCFPVKAEDTTAAGDTFNAGFARALASGAALRDAIVFANAAAGISVTKMGAQGGMPDLRTVYDFLEERGYHEFHLS